MFNLQGSELVIILLLALVVLGPEKLPDAMRKMGQFYGELKKMSSGFQQEFRSVIDEPLREVRETANALRDSADFTKLQTGERDEKPKSAEMLAVPDPATTPVDEVPTFEGGSVAPAESDDDDASEGADEPALDPFASSVGFSAAPAARIDAGSDDAGSDDAGSDDAGSDDAEPAADAVVETGDRATDDSIDREPTE